MSSPSAPVSASTPATAGSRLVAAIGWPMAGLFAMATFGAPPSRAVPAAPPAPRYDHRVVVATTPLDRREDIDGSLERHVNRLGALGYELAALAGGDAAVLDEILDRKPTVFSQVEHAGLTFAVMVRPLDQPVVAREYRLLHTRTGFEMDAAVAPLGPAGFHMTAHAFDGAVVHVAFERRPQEPPAAFRVFMNRGRRTWMDQALADPDVRLRIARVVPLALDAAVIELGPPQATAADMQWLSQQAHLWASLESPLRGLTAAGYRVELVRARENNVSALVVKPAGTNAGTADYDLDDGPWGGPCSRGALAGVAVLPDGDVACAADRSRAEVSNRGLDLTLSPQTTARGQILFRGLGLDCEMEVRLESPRPTAARVALAVQFEREIAKAIQPGYRVARVVAARDAKGQRRLVAFTTDAPQVMPAGPPVAADAPGLLTPDEGGRGTAAERQREDQINAALAGDARFRDRPLWIELDSRPPFQGARVFGCVPDYDASRLAGAAVRDLLNGQGLARFRVDNRVVLRR